MGNSRSGTRTGKGTRFFSSPRLRVRGPRKARFWLSGVVVSVVKGWSLTARLFVGSIFR
jgi:hypothetical protein